MLNEENSGAVKRGSGGVLPFRGLMGCAAGWGRVFTTGLIITELHFYKS